MSRQLKKLMASAVYRCSSLENGICIYEKSSIYFDKFRRILPFRSKDYALHH